LPQLVETKGLGEDVSSLPIHRNMSQFDFTRKDTLMEEMIMHVDVLCPCMEAGFFASWMLLRLLEWITVGSYTSSCRSLSSRFNHIASHVATAAPRYSASVLGIATVGCFLLLHAIAALPRVNAYPDVDQRSAALPAQSASV
jgi:hypothetical protein